MKKLTAGIFAGILTIVTVNAADAAIASKAYVDAQDKVNTTAITNLTTTVEGHTTSIGSLQEAVNNLSGDGTGSVADQIADALGEDFPADSTVQAELAKKADKTALEDVTKDGGTIDTKISAAQTTLNTEIAKKQDKSTADYAMGTQAGGWKALTADELGALQSGITSAGVTQITTNKTDIAGINTKIGTVAEGKTVVGLIDEAKNAAAGDVDTKLGDLGEGNNTVADALAKKQNMLNGTNVKETGNGNAIVSITAADGVVTATKGAVIPEVTTTGQTGTYVLTATVTESGVTNYMWESIERATAQTTEP